jgi:N-acetylmuramoyl-L-alanine amidase
MFLKNHKLLNPEISFFNCEKNKQKIHQLDTIVLHYTAGSSGLSSAKYLARSDIKASAHLVIDRSGKIYQLVPFDTIAWHAGKSQHNGRKNLNKYSIGIEFDNSGKLSHAGGKYYTWFNKLIPRNQIYIHKKASNGAISYWHQYTPEQIQVGLQIVHLLIQQYKIQYILGHNQIAINRKFDPGPAFPMHKFQKLLP